jgi:hypothetical protein
VTETIQDELRTALRRLGIATVVLYVALAGLGVYFYLDAAAGRERIAEVTENTNVALCSLRGDLERRVATSIAFLEANPEGIPGIPVQVIQQSITSQQQTITALAILECSDPLEP